MLSMEKMKPCPILPGISIYQMFSIYHLSIPAKIFKNFGRCQTKEWFQSFLCNPASKIKFWSLSTPPLPPMLLVQRDQIKIIKGGCYQNGR